MQPPSFQTPLINPFHHYPHPSFSSITSPAPNPLCSSLCPVHPENNFLSPLLRPCPPLLFLTISHRLSVFCPPPPSPSSLILPHTFSSALLTPPTFTHLLHSSVLLTLLIISSPLSITSSPSGLFFHPTLSSVLINCPFFGPLHQPSLSFLLLI